MKKYFRVVILLLTIFLILGYSKPSASVEKAGKTMTILFTHDLHDHFKPFNINQNGTVNEFGGYARLQTAINQEKELDPESLLVDGGDFSMGTLFQSIYATDAPQLRIMGQMGYDVVTLGNHEFDFRAQGLAESLKAAKNSGDKLPQIVISNLTYPSDKIGKKHAEDTLGNLISDAFIYAVKKAEGSGYDPIAVAIVPSGTIRSSFVKGDITVADTFSVSSLGVGKDGISGYPLISVYLTGKELKTACEVDASIAPIMDDAQLYMSGLNFSFNPNRLIFNKVTQATLQKPDGNVQEIDDQELYRVVVSLYSAQMLSVVGDKSLGLLSIVPKTKDGTPITDFEAQIITDKVSGRNHEIKEWLATAEYLKSFDKVNEVSQIPQYYNATHGRKIVDDNNNVLALVSNPNNIALAVFVSVIFLIVFIVTIIKLVTNRYKCRKEVLQKF